MLLRQCRAVPSLFPLFSAQTRKCCRQLFVGLNVVDVADQGSIDFCVMHGVVFSTWWLWQCQIKDALLFVLRVTRFPQQLGYLPFGEQSGRHHGNHRVVWILCESLWWVHFFTSNPWAWMAICQKVIGREVEGPILLPAGLNAWYLPW